MYVINKKIEDLNLYSYMLIIKIYNLFVDFLLKLKIKEFIICLKKKNSKPVKECKYLLSWLEQFCF